jgi:hypothetical protein
MSVDVIIDNQPQMNETDLFHMSLDDVRATICNPNDPNPFNKDDSCFWEIQEGERIPSFHYTKCFRGRKWQTEIDAVISDDSGELCFIEYEEKFGLICNNFMKMHRLKRAASDRQIGSLFVIRSSDRKDESALNRFDNYMNRVSPYLDTLLGQNWSVLALVNLLTGQPVLKWYTETDS